jgi:hypothetical protein
MALNDDATLIVGTGTYYTATTDTAFPADPLAPGGSWENVGHTSLEDIFAQASEGGEKTVIGTLQNASLRTTYSARSETFTFTLQQFDEAALKLYYGGNAVVNGELLEVPTDPVPTEKAFLAVFEDGENYFCFYAPKSEVFRGDDLSIADTESLAGLPVAVTPLVSGSNDYAYAVTPLGEVASS